MRQALINLLGNAVKFTDSGSVELLVKTHGSDEYSFEVCDTGPGIPEEKQAAIFEPFQQDTAGLQHGGTGLGLAISTRHIEMMGGRIQLESRLGEGSRFFSSLQLSPGREGEEDRLSADWH
jgi:signal transduction histidine kinase